MLALCVCQLDLKRDDKGHIKTLATVYIFSVLDVYINFL